MNRNEVIQAVETAKLLPVMEAWLEGKTIQLKNLKTNTWMDVNNPEPPFGDSRFLFRIKPEPRRWTIIVPFNGEPYLATLTTPSSEILGAKEFIEVVEVLK